MKQLQVIVPKKRKEEVEDVLENYSNDISSTEGEKNDEKTVEFTLTAESEQLDDLTKDLKGLKNLESGDLSIRVIKQESLIRKGQETKGSTSMLSHEEVYSKAQEAAEFNKAQWALVFLSAVIASYGLAADNIAVVIGAMMLAPVISPFVSGSLGLIIGDFKLLRKSLFNALMSVLLVVAASFIASIPFNIVETSTLTLISEPSLFSVLLSVAVGFAAALTFSTGLRDQIAGVAVAIALVPPLAAAGIGLRISSLTIAVNALSIASLNILAVFLSGSISFFFLRFKPETYYKKKHAEKVRQFLPVLAVVFLLVSVFVALDASAGYDDYITEQQVQQQVESFYGERLVSTQITGESAVLYVYGDKKLSEIKNKVPENIDLTVYNVRPKP